MATVGTMVLVIQSPTDNIAQLASKLASTDHSSRQEMMRLVGNFISAVGSGYASGSTQLTIRDTAPTITTSGTGSTQYNF